MREERTRALLFGVFLEAGEVSAPQLIALARPLGITATNAKSHLSRLVAEGVVRRRGLRRLGVYSLTAKQRPIVEAISLRLEEPPVERWAGDWLTLAVRPAHGRQAREAIRAQLWFDGFRPWGREVWLRPAWPLPWALERAGGQVSGGAGLCVRGALIGAPNVEAIRALFATERLDREAEALAAKVARQNKSFRTDAQAFAARLTLAGRVVNVIARDPRLPREVSMGTGLARLRVTYRDLMAVTEAPARAFVRSVTHPPAP